MENEKLIIQGLKSLAVFQQEYINILDKEITNMAGLAFVHGWKSKLVQEGMVIRDKIKDAKNYLLTLNKEESWQSTQTPQLSLFL